MVKAIKPGLDIHQSCSALVSHWVADIKLEGVIAVWAPVFSLKITHSQLVV